MPATSGLFRKPGALPLAGLLLFVSLLASGCGSSDEAAAEPSGAASASMVESPAARGDVPGEHASEEAPAEEAAPTEGEEHSGEETTAAEDGKAPADGAPTPESAAEIAKDRAGLPKDFPQNVPTPAGGRLTTSDTIGTGSERSWMASFTGTAKGMASQCAAYATMLEGAGYQSVAGTADVGLALRGSSHDLTMLCGATSIDLIVNPRLI